MKDKIYCVLANGDAYLHFGFDTAILEKALEDTISQEEEDDETDDE